MPLWKKFDDGESVMGLWKMTETLCELESRYVFKSGECEIYTSFRNDRRRKEWLTVRLLLAELVGCDAVICYRESGFPFLKDSNLCISITHTIGYVGIRIASHPVAIDMEYISNRVLRLLDKFLTPQEFKLIKPEARIESALVLWSSKEAMFKLFDHADLLFDQNLLVSDLDLVPPVGKFVGHISKGDFCVQVQLRYEIADDYVLVYC